MDTMHPITGIAGASGVKAILHLYSPKQYGNVVLRPFMYGFTSRTVDKLLGAGDTLKDALARPDIANNPDVVGCIKPDSTGSVVDMTAYDLFWTFALVIVQPNNYIGTAVSAPGYRTTIMTGHCLDEPINPLSMYMTTPTPNFMCRLVVHSHQILNTGAEVVNAFGMTQPTKVVTTEDIIDPSMNQNAPGSDLYRMAPTDILENYQYNGTEESSLATPGLCAVANTERTPIQTTLKTPGVHLRQIVESLDTQIEFSRAQAYSPHSLGVAGVLSDCEDTAQFAKGVKNVLSQYTSGGRIETDGIKANDIFTINDIMAVYPNLQIQPYKISEHTMYGATGQYMDIIPQTVMNPKVTYSSMIASSVSALAADCGLSSMSFAFTTDNPAKGYGDRSDFRWAGEAYLTCPPPDPAQADLTLKGALTMFKHLFQQNVVPFVKGVVGDFEVFVQYSNNSETHVNLTLKDWGSNTNLGSNLWFEAPNRLGSLSSTSIGSEAAFMSNGASIGAFISDTQAKVTSMDSGVPMQPVYPQQGQVTNISGFSGF